MTRNTSIIVLVFAAIVSRLIPHWPNFTPVLASALFAGFYLKDKKWAPIVPLAIMVISDLFLPTHNLSSKLFSYAAMIIVSYIGVYGLKKNRVLPVAMASIAGSVIFFLLSNFGSWVDDPWNLYADDLSGLIASYTMALPFTGNPGAAVFFYNAFLGDLFYNALLFGGFAIAEKYVPALRPATVQA